MKRTAHLLLIALAVTGPAVPASAGMLDSMNPMDMAKQAVSGNSASSTPGTNGLMNSDMITTLLQKAGYSNIGALTPTTSGNLQTTATDKSGSLVNLLINPSSGSILQAK